MFRSTRKPSSGSHRQYLAKITHSVQCGYMELVQDVVSVMAAYAATTLTPLRFIRWYWRFTCKFSVLRFPVTRPQNSRVSSPSLYAIPSEL